MARPPVSVVLASLTASFLTTPAAGQTRPFTAADMLDVVQISGDVAASPDGDRLAFVLPDLSDEWNVGERQQLGSVHISRIDGTRAGEPEPIGRPGQRSSYPVFSPDGTRLAFYFEGPAGGHLAVWDAGSGEVTRVGALFSGRALMPPQWAGDARIVYARADAPESPPDVPRVRVLEIDDALPGDEVFRNQRLAGLAVVDLAAGTELTLIEDGTALRRFAVSSDGRHVVANQVGVNGTALWSLDQGGGPRTIGMPGDQISWLPDGRLLTRRGPALLVQSPEAGAEPEVPFLEPDRGGGGRFASLIVSPDATRFAALAPDASVSDPEIETPQPGVYTIARPFMDLFVGSTRSGEATNLTGDFPDQVRSPVWSASGGSLFFVARDNETYDETLYRYDASSDRLSVLATGRESYGDLIPIPGGLVAAIGSATYPADLWRIDASSGARTRLTELNPQLADFSFIEPELFHFESLDGDRLGALLYRPSAGADVPVVTYVYEKLTPGIHRFQPRQQIFATHGYAVLMPNVKVKVGETGTSYVRSVVPAVDSVHGMGFTNGRACMWGGSFGAYATSYVITQTDVFDCAVSRATPPELFRNWASGRDRDSNNIERGQARMGGSPFEVMERYIAQSAFFHLDQVETPVLITHGMKDYTILFEEGAMMFYALRRLGKEATLVAYREGDHSLYRHSRADALDVHQRMLDWFAKYLRR